MKFQSNETIDVDIILSFTLIYNSKLPIFLHWFAVRGWSFHFMVEKLCVKIEGFLYDFGWFQAWTSAFFDKNIQKLGVKFCGNCQVTSTNNPLSICIHIKLVHLRKNFFKYKSASNVGRKCCASNKVYLRGWCGLMRNIVRSNQIVANFQQLPVGTVSITTIFSDQNLFDVFKTKFLLVSLFFVSLMTF